MINKYLNFTGFMLVVLMSVLACRSSQERIYLSEINDNLNQIDSIQDILKALRVDSIQIVKDDCQEVLNILSNSDFQNNKSRILQQIDYAGDIYKSCKKFLPKYQHFQKEFSISGQQLESLKHDIEHGLIADSLATQYIENESYIISSLYEKFKLELKIISDSKKLYSLEKDKMHHLCDSIQSLSADKKKL